MRSARWVAFAVVSLMIQPTGGHAATVVGGSDLLVGSALSQVENWLVNDPQLSYSGSLQFTNIFDKAAGNNASDFHAAVDGKGPTIVVMEATGPSGGTQIIGGFNPQSWSSIFGVVSTPNLADRTGFIFNLSTTDRRDQTVQSAGDYQTLNSLSSGPVFGAGHDIHVGSSLNTGYLYSLTYCSDPASSCSNSAGYLNLLGLLWGGSLVEVTFGRMEVFTIAETSPVPLPAALPLFVTGLGALGLLGWRKRRKKSVAAVPA